MEDFDRQIKVLKFAQWLLSVFSSAAKLFNRRMKPLVERHFDHHPAASPCRLAAK
jgi:hypothetical protein